MKNIQKINDDLFYIGVQDRKIALFEAVYPVINGVSYNSYFLNDEKTVLFDTVDKHFDIPLKNKDNNFFPHLKYDLYNS